jgi:succinyl-diaminopimelate desuccinylase
MSCSVINSIELTQQLIRCPSITPKDEGAQKVLITALESLGFECHTLQYEDVTNLFARLGNGSPHISFCGHTDVVPVGDEGDWNYPPFSAEIENGVLFGRGAVDMKGSIACFIEAIDLFLKKNGQPEGSISLLITGDEEGPAINGTVKVLKWMEENGHIPDFFVGGEPTNPSDLGQEIKIGRRGSMCATLNVSGTQGHAAYPKLADNPLPRLIKMLDILASYEFDNGTEYFQPTNLEITSIDVGNSASNVIPAKGSALINIRFNDIWTSKSIEEKLRVLLNQVTDSYELNCSSNAESFMTKAGKYTEMVSLANENILGKKPELTTNGGTSDARFCINYAPIVECGLINATAHHVDEHIKTEDLEKLTLIYEDIFTQFFNG